MADELSSFQRDLLSVIAGRDGINGLEVKRRLEDRGGDEVNHGRLYPNLDMLDDEGIIEKQQHDDRSNAYFITENGLDAITRFHGQWEDAVERLDGGGPGK